MSEYFLFLVHMAVIILLPHINYLYHRHCAYWNLI